MKQITKAGPRLKKAFFILNITVQILFIPIIKAADLIPPAAISDLTGTAVVDQRSVILTWTTPGNDGTMGNIPNGFYNIRCATYPIITDSDWQRAQSKASIWVTITPGTTAVRQIDNLSTNTTTFWFSIKTRDDSNNFSSLSNSPSVDLQIFPPAAITDLAVVSNGPLITLKWTAPGDDGTSVNIVSGRYNMFYSSSPFSDIHQANRSLFNISTNTAPGNNETYIITKGRLLVDASVFWFGILTSDDVYNWSPQSNITQVSIIVTDTVPPAKIESLSGSATYNNSNYIDAILVWNTTGNDGTSGVINGGRYNFYHSTAGPIITQSDRQKAYYNYISTDTVPDRTAKISLKNLSSATTAY